MPGCNFDFFFPVALIWEDHVWGSREDQWWYLCESRIKYVDSHVAFPRYLNTYWPIVNPVFADETKRGGGVL